MSAAITFLSSSRRLLDQLWKKFQPGSQKKGLTTAVDSRAKISSGASKQVTPSKTAIPTETVTIAFDHVVRPAHLSAANHSSPSAAHNQPLQPSISHISAEQKPNLPHQINDAIEAYLLALKLNNCSRSTIRNYKSDIKQFCNFANETKLDAVFTKPKLLEFAEDQAKKGLQTASIKRKLVSIAQFAVWARRGKLITDHRLIDSLHRAETEELLAFTSPKQSASQPESTAAISQEPSITQPVATQPAAELVSRWLPYFNLSLLSLFLVGLGYFTYQQFQQADPSLAYPATLTRPDRILSFQGRLTNTGDTPIVGATGMRFRLYDDPSGGSELWDSNACSVDPDQDGIFNANLGAGAGGGSDDDDCGAEIDPEVFSENSNVWLEVTVGAETLTPRQPIRTVAYALNSETLQGFPITSGGAVASSVVSMDSSGQVILAENSPELIGTTGTFTISAPAVAITTTSGTNGNITLAPDGTGKVNVSSDLGVNGATSADITSTTTTASVFNSTVTTLNVGGAATSINLGPTGSGASSILLSGGSSDTGCTVNGANGNLTCTGTVSGGSIVATSLPFSGITSGTNTTAAMVVGAGASLDYASTGTINASTLIGNTWAIPGAIGSTTPNSGVFTNLSSTGNTTFGDASGDTVTSNAAAWTFANDTTVALTGGVNGLNFDANTLSIDATNDRVGIGTAAPSYTLDVNNGSAGSNLLRAIRTGTSRGITLTTDGILTASGNETGGATSTFFQFNATLNRTSAGQPNYAMHITAAMDPTSGSSTPANLVLDGTVNQTGGASGISRGLYINPTITAAADYRALDIAVNSTSGYGVYQSGANSSNYFAGNVGIGDTTPTAALTVGNGDLFQINSSGIIAALDGVAHTIDDVSGNLTLTSNGTAVMVADDLGVNGATSADITTTTTTASIFNTTATTLSLGGAATTMNVGPTGSGASSILLSGGSADTGCTIDGATGNLTCSGIIAGAAATSKWNAITNPDGNLALTMAAYTTTMGWTSTGALDAWTMNFNNNSSSSTTQDAMVINNAAVGSFTDTSTENLLLLQQLDTTAAGTTGVANAIKVDVAASSGMTNGLTVTNSGGDLTTGINIADTAGGTLTTGIALSGTFTTGIDAGNSIITNIGNAATDFDSSGGLTLAGNLSVQGNTTIGNASGDTVTVNSAAWTFANDTNFALSGGVNGLSLDTDTLSVDSTNNRIGLGTTAPAYRLQIHEAGGQSDMAITTNVNVGSANTTQLSFVSDLDGTAAFSSIGQFNTGDLKLSGVGNLVSPDMTITTGGNVGVGTTGPDRKLEINSATGANLRLTYNDSNGSATNYTDFSLASDGDLTIDSAGGAVNLGSGDDLNLTTAGDLIFGGTTSLAETTAANDSGAFLVGTFDEFDYSNSANVQDVLDDLDAQIGNIIAGTSGLWTDSGTITYLTSTADDFAIGGTTLGTSIFSIDESAGTFLFGGDQSANPTLTFEATDSDTGDFGFNTDDSFYLSGANLGIGDTSPNSLFTVGSGDLFQINSTGQVGLQQAPVSDYLMALAGTTGNDNSRVIDITQANNASEDSATIYTTNTANIGTVTSGTNNMRHQYLSMTPTGKVQDTATLNIYGDDYNIGLSNLTQGYVQSSNNRIRVYGSSMSLTGSPVSGTSTPSYGLTETMDFYGYRSNIDFSPIFSAPRDVNSYGGYFLNSMSSPGDSGSGVTAYGVAAETNDNLTTTGFTTHYAGYFSAAGSADNNYGIYVNSSSGATNNYGLYINTVASAAGNYAIYSNAAAQSYIAGNVGIGDTSPAATLTVGSGDLFQVAGASGDITTAGDLALNGGDLTTSSGTFNLANAATTLNLGSTNVTRTINIGTGTNADTINIGTGGTTADAINIGGLSTTTVGVNTGAWTFANDTNFVLSGGVNGLSLDTNTLSVDATNDRIGIGTTSPLVKLDVAGSARVTGTATSVITGSIDPDGIANPDGSGEVTGVGTLFTTELVVGDKITVSGETRTIIAITSDTALTVDVAFTNTANDTSVDKIPAVFITRNSSNNLTFFVNESKYAFAKRWYDIDNRSYYLEPGASSSLNSLTIAGNIAMNDSTAITGTNLTFGSGVGTTTLGGTTVTAAAATINLGPTGSGASSIILSGGSADTGCTVNGANGNLTCSGVGSFASANFSSLTASRAVFTDASSNLVTTGASADLLNALSDETGTGVAVFGTSPTITTSLVAGSSSFDLLNTTATTINFGGAATTSLNIGNGNTAYTAINIGSGTGGNTINLGGTGATGADTINIGTGGTGADTITFGNNASTTSLALTSGTGDIALTSTDQIRLSSSKASGGTTTEAFSIKSTADLGTADELLQIGDSGADMVTIFGNGNVGIGTTTTNGQLTIGGTANTADNGGILVNTTFTGTQTGPWGANIQPIFSPPASTTYANAYGLAGIGKVNLANTAGNVTNLYGGFFRTDSITSNTGTLATAYAVYASAPSYGATAKPTTQYGVFIGNQGVSGITTSAGLNVSAQSGSTTNYAAVFGGGAIDITDTSNVLASLALTNNTATTFGAGANTAGVIDLQSTSLTTGNFLNLEVNGLTSGKGINLTSTSTGLTTGSIFNLTASGNPGATWTGNLGLIEYITSTDADIDGSALKVGITGAGAGDGTALNVTTAQTGSSALALRVNDDGTYTDSTAFVVDENGSVGIGTTSPADILEVSGTNPRIRLTGSGTTQFLQTASSTGHFWDNNGIGLDAFFRVSNASNLDTTPVTLRSNGYVGVGDTNPDATLDVVSTDIFSARFETSNADSRIRIISTAAVATSNVSSIDLAVNSSTQERSVGQIIGSFSDTTDATRTSLIHFSSLNNGSGVNVITIGGANVGISDATPTEAKLVVGGDIFINTFTNANTRAVCLDAAGASLLYDCLGTPADIAEFYPGTADAEPGDIVVLTASGNGSRVALTSTPYNQNIFGIVSTFPTGPNGDVMGETTIPESEHPQAIGLVGKVPLKVSLENGPIAVNDWLTTSSTPGVAMKATKTSRVIGQALEAYDGSIQVSSGTRLQEEYRRKSDLHIGKDPTDPPAGIGKILVFTNPTYYDPHIALNDAGDVILTGTSQDTYAVATPTGTTSTIGAFAAATIAKLQVGFANMKELLAERATITHLQTSDISPVASDSAVTVHGELAADKLSAATISAQLAQLAKVQAETVQTQTLAAQTATISGSTQLGSLLANTASVRGELTTGSLLASLVQTDTFNANQANISTATISALTTDTITGGSARLNYLESKVAQLESAKVDSFTAMTATISGTLYAANIADFDQKVANTFRQPSLLATLLNQNPGSIPDLPVASGSGTVASSAAQLRHTLAELDPSDDDIIINPTALFVKRYFEVTGDSYLAGSVGIGSALVIGDGLRLSSNELAYTPTQGGPVVFKIQPSGIGKLELLGGQLTLSDTGLAVINGDLRVAGAFTSDGDVTTKGDIQLVGPAGATAATISSAGAINTTGSITSSSSISGTLATFSNLKLGSEQLTATGSGTVDTSKPTGRAKLSATQTEITLKSELVTPQTLIYITPIGSTNNQVLYVKSQTPEDLGTSSKEGEFKIGVDQPLAQDIEFTWWLVN